MTETEVRQCPDCDGALRPIKIMDNAYYGGRPAEGELNYMAPDAKRSFWTGVLPIEGKVVDYICDTCSRILLYGVPRET